MEFVQLKTSLRNRTSSAYLFFGTDGFLVNKGVNLVSAAAFTGNPDDKVPKFADIIRLDEDASAKEIALNCNTVSMFSSKRVVVVRNVTETVIKEMKTHLPIKNPDCVLILVSSSEKLPTGVPPTIEILNCNPISENMLHKLITKQFSDAGRSITPSAAALLAKFCANNYSRVDNEIRKLLLCFEGGIENSHIEALVVPQEDFQVFELGNVLCKRDVKTAQKIEARLLSSGLDAYAIFGNLTSMIRRFYYSLSTTASNDLVAAVCKCSPYAINYARRDNKHLAGRIKRLYAFALDLEYKIKSGLISAVGATTLLQMALVV